MVKKDDKITLQGSAVKIRLSAASYRRATDLQNVYVFNIYIHIYICALLDDILVVKKTMKKYELMNLYISVSTRSDFFIFSHFSLNIIQVARNLTRQLWQK